MTLGGLLNFIRRSANFDQDQINKLVQETHETTEPIVGDFVERRIVKYGDIREKINTFTTSNPDSTNVETVERGSYFYRKKIDETVKSHPLTYSTTGTITFEEGSGGKFGGGGVFDGSSYIIVSGETPLKTENNYTIACWVKTPAAFNTNYLIVYEGETGGDGFGTEQESHLHITSNGTIGIRIEDGSDDLQVESSVLSINTWYHVVAVAKNLGSSPEVELYIDGSSAGTDTAGSAITRSSMDVGLQIGKPATATRLLEGTLSWLTILRNAVNSTWVTNHYNGVLDLSDGNDEILTIPFTASDQPKSDATSGECRST